MMPPSSSIVAAVVLPCALVAAGCGASSDPASDLVVPGQALDVTSAAGLAKGTVRLDGTSIVEGKNAFVVDFDPSTTQITSASTLMPVHGHGSATPTVSREGGGYRVADVVFNMPGLWQVRLAIDVAGTPDRFVFAVDAP